MKFFYTILLLLIVTFTFAQNKRVQEKADDLYKNEQYAEAIPLYKEVLAENDNLATKTKLAYCFRVNNNLAEAEKLYSEVVQNDKAKAITWFYYGETLMGNSKYTTAKKWLQDYQKMEPDDERAALLIRACDEVPNIQPYFPYVYIREFPYNSDADDNSAVVFDGQIIFSSDRKQGVKLLKQKSGWTGRDYLRLYACLVSEDMSKILSAEPYSARLTELNKNTGNASFTADGTEVYFTKNNNELSKRNAYNLQIFRATSDGDEKWKDIEKLDFCSGEYNYMHPAISPDGKHLFFVSDKPRGEGGTDIYWTTRRSDGSWSKVKNLGTTINTPSHEGFPFFNKNNELYFCSKGHIGYGGFDIFVSQLDMDENWSTPTNLGKPLNSSLDDISIYLNDEKNGGLFTSSRANGDDDIYLFDVGRSPIAPQQRQIATTPPVMDTTQLAAAPRIENEVLRQALQQPAVVTSPEEETEEIVAEVASDFLAETTPKEIVIEDEKLIEEQVMMQVDSAIQANLPIVDNTVSSTLEATTEVVTESSEEEEEINIRTTNSQVISPEPEPEPTIASTSTETTGVETALSTPNLPVQASSPVIDQLATQLSNQKYAFPQNIVLENINYSSDAIELNNLQSLDRLISFLQEFPNVEIELGVHTTGDKVEAPRRKLTEMRAYSAAAYLVENGIKNRRIVPRGYGSSRLGENVLTIKILAF